MLVGTQSPEIIPKFTPKLRRSHVDSICFAPTLGSVIRQRASALMAIEMQQRSPLVGGRDGTVEEV